jgi:AcrR family transcriptional regulator
MPTTAPAPTRRAAALPPDERRSAIVAATLPLLIAHGEMVTTRQIADAAGIAEGTIFRVFADKDAVIAAAVETALDNGPLDEHLRAIDPSLAFEGALVAAVEILQQRVVDIWRLASSIGPRFHDHKPSGPVVEVDALIALFEAKRAKLRVEPLLAARHLRTLTMSATHPMMVGEPMAAPEIVALFLHGVFKGSSSKGKR